jgi:hypothetical protein
MAALAALVAVCVGGPAATASTATAFPFGSQYRVLVSPKGSGITPASGWQNISFADESSWALQPAPFGNNAGCQPVPSASEFPLNGTLYLRKHLSLPAGVTQLHLHLRIDSNVSVYVNGQSVGAFTDGNCGTAITDVTVPNNVLVTGDNVVAIKADDNGAVSYLDLEATYEEAPPLPPSPASVALLSAVPTGSSSTVDGLLVGNPGATTVAFFAGATCAAAAQVSTAVVTIPAVGGTYFSQSVPAGSGKIYAKANGGDQSNCIPIGTNNTSWPNAAPLNGSADGYISTPGESRWYKFRPGTDAQVALALSNLAANYDLAFFKDIAQAYVDLTSPNGLTQLSAEFAGDAYSPSQFSPSQFSPSQFSPDAFSPSQFSPDAFSPSQFSPSQFSPSQFSPSQFSPSQFSPSQFSPDAFSPSQFSPSQFSPSQFSADAFSSAQTRSLIAISALDGSADETISANTWDNAADVYVRVSGRNGAFSDSQPFHLTDSVVAGTCSASVAPVGSPPAAAAAGGYKTVILTDPARMTGSAAEKSTLAARLATFAARPEVAGVVIDLGADGRISALNAQADANKSCPYAKNLLAGAIKDIVDSYRAANPLRYVVIAGADDIVPFFRYPDATLLGNEKGYVPPVLDSSASQASLRLGYVLGQDGYGSDIEIEVKGSTVPVPDLAVGRLVESPAEITGMLNAYLGTLGGVVPTPSSSLVTGYDFLADAANAVKSEFAAGTGATPDTLITPANVSPLDPSSWTATQLRTKLLGSRHDLVFLAGHFSANSALAADFTTSVLTTQLDASSVDLTNSIVFSAGCHSGYNIVDRDGVPGVTVPLDWAEAFAKRGATLVAGTGYQYGDTDFLEYSERLYLNFAKDLRAGTGAVPVGQALVDAKQQYLAGTQLLEGLHQKAVIEATLFGLPMLSVNLPAGRGGTGGGGGSVVGGTTPAPDAPGSVLGLSWTDMTFSPPLAQHTINQANVDNPGSSVTATWLSGPNGIATSPLAPTLPLDIENATVSGKVLRGVGFRSGSYADTTVTPLTGTPTTEIRGIHNPFSSSTFYPARPWSINYFDALADAGGATQLMLTPAQYRSTSIGSQTSTQRRYGSLGLRLYYSGNTMTTPDGSTPALAAPPTIADVSANPGTPGAVNVRAHVVGNPAAGIQDTWITYSDASATAGNWTSLDLMQDPVDSTLWTGTLSLGAIASGDLRFMVQSVNGVGLVTLDDNNGAYYRVNPPAGAPAPQPTQLSLDNPPSSGQFGTSITVAAVLQAGGSPLAGKVVMFAVGAQTVIDTTDANGRAQASLPLLVRPGVYVLRATFGGTNTEQPSSDESSLTVTKQPTTLVLTPSSAVGDTGFAGGITATLRAGGEPVPERTIAFILKGPGGTAAATAITNFFGEALLPAVQLPSGTYTVTAYFAGTIPFPAPAGFQTFADPAYLPSSDSATLTLSARGGLKAIRDEINAVSATGVLGNKLRSVVLSLDKALDPALWIDGTHVRFPPSGNQVFQGLKDAVQTLLDVPTLAGTPPYLRDRIQPWIDGLVGIGRDLASIAISEAAASPGVDQKKLAAAQADFASGKAVESSTPYVALERYRQAWSGAIAART